MPRFNLHLFLLALLPLTALAEISVTARFNPPRIALGDRSQYLVEITETSTSGTSSVERVTSLPIPSTGGLDLKNGRTSSSQQTRIINGQAEYSVTQSLIIDASAPSEGTYQIPGYVFEYKGQTLQAPVAKLQVVPRSEDAGPTRDELIFLQANLPKELYIGEKISFDLQLYVEESVSLNGLNRFNRRADGFTSSELPDEPQNSTDIVDGRRYRVLTWPMTLTPIQTGAQGLSFELSVTARLPEQRNRDPLGRSPFGRSMFDDFFGRSEQFNVYTDTKGINVLPLPDGQPDSFSGAVGDFAIVVTSDSTEGTVGEPIMLSVELSGNGNFDRIDGPILPESATWKSYEPESKFEQSDALGLRGSKRFDYVLIPQLPGKLQLPKVSFTYFDTKTKEYVTLESPALELQVAPSTVPQPHLVNAPQVSSGGDQEAVDLTRSLTAEEALTTLDYQPRSSRAIETKIGNDRAFIIKLVALTLVAALACIVLHIRKKNRKDPLFQMKADAKDSSKNAWRKAQDAQSSGASDVFYREAQLAIRHKITAKSGKNCVASGISELTATLEGLKTSNEIVDEVAAFFKEADAFRFGGKSTEVSTKSNEQFERIMKAL